MIIAVVCPFFTVLTSGLDLSVPFGDQGEIPRGTIVRTLDDECSRGVKVEVVSHNWRYHVETPVAPGAVDCLPRDQLKSVEKTRFLASNPPPGGPPPPLPPGTLLSDLEQIECDATKMLYLRPITDENLEALRNVATTYEKLFGPISLDRISFTDWGYVGLPIQHFHTSQQIEASYQKEKLVTTEQKEKAVTATGFSSDEGEVYLHFLGADPRYTDLWGTPKLVSALLELAAGWYAHCTKNLEQATGANANTCTVQYGDLAYYNPRQPDPLGHYDHHRGKCVDIRLFRTDASRYEAWWNRDDDREGWANGYGQALNRAFVQWVVDNVELEAFYFNDPAVIGSLDGVKAVRGHDDHFHLCVP